MRVLITGGTGFVGSFAAVTFVEAGHAVCCFDRNPAATDILDDAGAKVTIVEGDVRDPQQVASAASAFGAEGIVHTAAAIGQDAGAADPVAMYGLNVGGTVAVLEAARAQGLRVVYVSTATLYGYRPDLRPLSESERPEPVGIYDTTKLMAETLVVTYHKVYGLDTVAVRPGYVYGPRNSTGGYFLDRVFAGEVVEQPVGADLPLDPTYVKDLAQGIYLAMTVRPLRHRIFNITGGVLRSRGEVAEIARRLVPGADIRLGPGAPPHAHLRGPSELGLAREELGYRPRFGLEAGMADWLLWLRRRAEPRG